MKLLAGSSSPMAIMMVVSAGVMWAGSGLGAQNVYEKSSINAMELTAFRMIMAGIILLGMTVWEGKFKSSMKAMNEHKLLWLDVLIYAVVGLMLMHYTYFEAIAYGDAPTATVILYSCPAMVVCYQAIREHHLPSETKMFTTFLAVFGTFLLVTGGNPATLNVSGHLHTALALEWCYIFLCVHLSEASFPQDQPYIYPGRGDDSGRPCVLGICSGYEFGSFFRA